MKVKQNNRIIDLVSEYQVKQICIETIMKEFKKTHNYIAKLNRRLINLEEKWNKK